MTFSLPPGPLAGHPGDVNLNVTHEASAISKPLARPAKPANKQGMNGPTFPLTHDVVLIGVGHTHALVLRMWGMRHLPGARLTLINPDPGAAYSGMLPGHIAGHYDRESLDIDLGRLARFANARLVLGAATHLDTANGMVHVPGRPPIGYDLASIDIGITSDLPDLPGFTDHAIPAKPLGPFASAWSRFVETTTGPARIAVIGAGVAGAELAMSLHHRLKQSGRPATITLIDRSNALSDTAPGAREKLLKKLQEFDISVIENTAISHMAANAVQLENGTEIPSDFTIGTAGATPHQWLARSGLDLTDGFLTTSETLQTSDPAIFAAGDCAHFAPSPRPKAGVFAVRQAPVLFHNLRARLTDTPLRPYRPQKRYLKLISLGGKSALADRPGLPAIAGPLIWRWKDHIDRKFMDRFTDLPSMPAPPLPREHTATLRDAIGDKPMCGGCGAKVGRDTLTRALAAPAHAIRDDITALPGDDAALLHTGGAQQVMTSDHLRAFTNDPVTMTRIAAIHALGDIWAMGAKPQAATATLILPRQSEALQSRLLAEIMTTARDTLHKAGAEIVGGHTSLGDELTIGFTLTGLCENKPITLQGAKPGDALILTKPIGSGTILAAEMQMKARGDWVADAYRHMTQDQSKASQILQDAHAMTDVTGFGLAGHLLNICEASHTAATLTLKDIPTLKGTRTLTKTGIRSTLYPQNRALLPDFPETPETDLLFDPQTAGGLLATVSAEKATALLQQLQTAGYPAAVIGQITSGKPDITLA